MFTYNADGYDEFPNRSYVPFSNEKFRQQEVFVHRAGRFDGIGSFNHVNTLTIWILQRLDQRLDKGARSDLVLFRLL